MGVQIGGKEYSLAGNCSPGVMLILKERLQSGEGRGENQERSTNKNWEVSRFQTGGLCEKLARYW